MKKEKSNREKIFETAIVLFAQKSYSSVGVRELAKAADVNIAMISYYFQGKNGILREMFEIFYDDLSKIIDRALDTTTAAEYYDVYASLLCDVVYEKSLLYWVVAKEYFNYLEEMEQFKLQATIETLARYQNTENDDLKKIALKKSDDFLEFGVSIIQFITTYINVMIRNGKVKDFEKMKHTVVEFIKSGTLNVYKEILEGE